MTRISLAQSPLKPRCPADRLSELVGVASEPSSRAYHSRVDLSGGDQGRLADFLGRIESISLRNPITGVSVRHGTRRLKRKMAFGPVPIIKKELPVGGRVSRISRRRPLESADEVQVVVSLITALRIGNAATRDHPACRPPVGKDLARVLVGDVDVGARPVVALKAIGRADIPTGWRK